MKCTQLSFSPHSVALKNCHEFLLTHPVDTLQVPEQGLVAGSATLQRRDIFSQRSTPSEPELIRRRDIQSAQPFRRTGSMTDVKAPVKPRMIGSATTTRPIYQNSGAKLEIQQPVRSGPTERSPLKCWTPTADTVLGTLPSPVKAIPPRPKTVSFTKQKQRGAKPPTKSRVISMDWGGAK